MRSRSISLPVSFVAHTLPSLLSVQSQRQRHCKKNCELQSLFFFCDLKMSQAFLFPTSFPSKHIFSKKQNKKQTVFFSSTHYHAVFTSCTDVISTVEPCYSALANKAQLPIKCDIFSPIRYLIDIVFSLLAQWHYKV